MPIGSPEETDGVHEGRQEKWVRVAKDNNLQIEQ
jgi:hypothetical protein